MAKKTYARVDDILRAIQDDVSKGARILAEATKDYLYDKTYTNLYQKMYSGEYYARTGQFLDSITMSFYSASGKYRIFFNGNKISKQRGFTGEFNAHADFNYDKIPIGDLVNWIENGHRVTNKLEKRDGAHMIRDTKKWLNDKIRTVAIKSGSGAGLESILKQLIILG